MRLACGTLPCQVIVVVFSRGRVWKRLLRHLFSVFTLKHQTGPVSGCAAWFLACLCRILHRGYGYNRTRLVHTRNTKGCEVHTTEGAAPSGEASLWD